MAFCVARFKYIWFSEEKSFRHCQHVNAGVSPVRRRRRDGLRSLCSHGRLTFTRGCFKGDVSHTHKTKKKAPEAEGGGCCIAGAILRHPGVSSVVGHWPAVITKHPEKPVGGGGARRTDLCSNWCDNKIRKLSHICSADVNPEENVQIMD